MNITRMPANRVGVKISTMHDRCTIIVTIRRGYGKWLMYLVRQEGARRAVRRMDLDTNRSMEDELEVTLLRIWQSEDHVLRQKEWMANGKWQHLKCCGAHHYDGPGQEVNKWLTHGSMYVLETY